MSAKRRNCNGNTLATETRVLAPENFDILESQSNLAKILIREGYYAEAEKMAREAFEVQLRTMGLQGPDTVDTLRQLGRAMAYSHRYPEASKLFRDAIDKESNSGGQGNRWSLWYAFACVAASADRPEDALQHLREAINRGYKDADFLMADDDLKSLRSSPHFQELVAELKRPPTKVQPQSNGLGHPLSKLLCRTAHFGNTRRLGQCDCRDTNGTRFS